MTEWQHRATEKYNSLLLSNGCPDFFQPRSGSPALLQPRVSKNTGYSAVLFKYFFSLMKEVKIQHIQMAFPNVHRS